MENLPEAKVSRKQVLIRLLYSLFFFIVLELVKLVVQLATVFQLVYLLLTLNYSEPLRRFANRVAAYGYRVMRYLTLNDPARPFPFQEFPGELEPPVSEVVFD
ncbi:MAG: DUF4389 domain-containing protein [Thermodesulfobacteriota bacterium]